MKEIVVTWRDDSRNKFTVKSFTRDRNGDFQWTLADGTISYVPKHGVFMVNVSELGDK